MRTPIPHLIRIQVCNNDRYVDHECCLEWIGGREQSVTPIYLVSYPQCGKLLDYPRDCDYLHGMQCLLSVAGSRTASC